MIKYNHKTERIVIMKLIICLDDKNGMLFNKRRQSRDSALNERVISLASGARLLMNSYSAKLFADCEIISDDNFLNTAEKGDFCFCEAAVESLENTEKIYVFRWNRHYPADTFFKFDIEKEGYVLESTEEFVGSSHEKITLDIYKKGE